MIVFDIETQNLAAEVGGWGNKQLLRLAVACTWDEFTGYRLWWESQAVDLIQELRNHDLIVGYNINSFDFQVLSFYSETKGLEKRSFDILGEISRQGFKRISQRELAARNLDAAISQESGVVAVRLWRQGKIMEAAAKCQTDVDLSKRLFDLWQNQGLLWLNVTDFVMWPGIDHLLDFRDR